MPPFCKLFGKRFFIFSPKSQSMALILIFFFENVYCKYDIKKILAYSQPYNFKISTNKMNQKAGFEIILERYEHVTYVRVRAISMITISMINNQN